MFGAEKLRRGCVTDRQTDTHTHTQRHYSRGRSQWELPCKIRTSIAAVFRQFDCAECKLRWMGRGREGKGREGKGREG